MSTAVKEAEVKETGVIFQAESVRAIIEGSKTQTRRVIKPQPHKNVARFVRSLARAGWLEEYDNGDSLGVFTGGKPVTWTQTGNPYRCPYGDAGDHIWVKETWLDSGLKKPFTISRGGPELPPVAYRADFPDDWLGHTEYRQKNSMFMPRWASRITLEITNVRAERLHEISNKDAVAEGLTPHGAGEAQGWQMNRYGPIYADFRRCFEDAWDSINRRRGFPFESNPWVWVIEFKKLSITK